MIIIGEVNIFFFVYVAMRPEAEYNSSLLS